MQFHDYQTLRRGRIHGCNAPEERRYWKNLSDEQYRRGLVKGVNANRRDQGEDDLHRYMLSAVIAEQTWAEAERPFYNLWPLVTELASSLKLDLPFSAIELPFPSLLLRFARGHELLSSCEVAMLHWGLENPNAHIGKRVFVRGQLRTSEIGCQHFSTLYEYADEDCVESWLQSIGESPPFAAGEDVDSVAWEKTTSVCASLIRAVVFVGLLSHDRDVISPLILSKDRMRYDDTDDEACKKWLEDRAARRMGRGFDVGAKLQEQKDRSPHWRNPHLCLFWTGEGRSKPIIKMRSGAVIQRVSMAEVPTGYLGPEAEDQLSEDLAQRQPVPKAKRFEVFKRDGYKCRLCGRTQEDGVKLHVDHRIPRAKGGANEDDNLWTLCEDCNLGKSDKEL